MGKTGRGIVFVVLGLLAFLPILGCSSLGAGVDDRNLVVNPDFESGSEGETAPGWTAWQKLDGSAFRVVRDPGVAHSGTQCVSIRQIAKDQRNFALWSQQMPVKAGTTCRFSFWIRTDDVQPFTRYDEDWPSCCGSIGFLDASTNPLPPYPKAANVFMTHEWQRFEISFRTPKGTSYVQISLVLANAVGTVYFDSISMCASEFHEPVHPRWLTDAVVYELSPWEYLSFGNGNAFRGIAARLPEMEALGVDVLYLLPIWEKEGWYNVADHFAIFRKYGTEKDLGALVEEAHRRGMRVILDLAGTIGVPYESRLRSDHPEWFILGGSGQPYRSWGDLCGLDQNRPEVQQYFVEVTTRYVERCDIDGYRCDMAMASPYVMYQKIREAIQRIKPEAILIAEDQVSPIGLETAFDAAYDFPFLDRVASLISDPHEAAATARWLEAQRAFSPPAALRMRYLEGHDLDSTIASRCGFTGARAFATFLLTIDGLPMICNGQEVGARDPRVGWWKPPIEWSNPDAARYREVYTNLTGIRARYPALRGGSLLAVASSDDRVAAYARVLPREQTILTVINFSDSTLETRLDLSPETLEVRSGTILSDLIEGARLEVGDPGSCTVTMEPYRACVFVIQ